jgi:hypothetical protein
MHIKFSPDEFLAEAELQTFKESLDDFGWRKFLLANSLRFGLIDKEFVKSGVVQNSFTNGLVTQGAGLTISINQIDAIDSSGNFIYSDAISNLATTNDNQFYWVKIKYASSSIEKGIVAIDAQGNLTGDANTRFLSKLRGQPNFPARISFIGSSNNLLEYDILEVISDSLAILDNSTFVAENNLQYQVTGTFTPSAVPSNSDKNIFQYDSCQISLILETVSNTRPTYIDGTEFFLARIKNNGTIVIQDKRTDLWQLKADFFASNIQQGAIPNFGVEKIKFSDQNSTLDKNILYLSWAFRSTNYTVNSNLNILTIIGGQGGKYKKTSDFNNSDFDGYRLYTSDGTYATIVSSVLVGGQINLVLDVLNIDKYSTDGGTTFTGDEIIITPDAEEIQIVCESLEDASISNIATGEGSLPDQIFNFPINTPLAKVELLVWSNPTCQYEISYRLKHGDVYGKLISMPSDINFGYFTENAFDEIGAYLPIVKSNTYAANLAGGYIVTYSSNAITLVMNAGAYSNEIARIDLGDLLGVDSVQLANAMIPVRQFYVGTDRQYQYFTGNPFTLAGDFYLNVNKEQIQAGGKPCKNGNTFYFHVKQAISPASTFSLHICQDYINPSSNTILKTFTANDFAFLTGSDQGFFFRITFDGTNWIINSVNEVSLITISAVNLDLFFASTINANQQLITLTTSAIADQDQGDTVFLNDFDTGNFDNGNNWSSSQYKAPSGGFTGRFLLSVMTFILRDKSFATSNMSFRISMRKNGVELITNPIAAISAAGDTINVTSYTLNGLDSGIITLVENDIIECMLVAHPNSGGANSFTIQVDALGQFSNQH